MTPEIVMPILKGIALLSLSSAILGGIGMGIYDVWRRK